jgi:HEAT repeat protein
MKAIVCSLAAAALLPSQFSLAQTQEHSRDDRELIELIKRMNDPTDGARAYKAFVIGQVRQATNPAHMTPYQIDDKYWNERGESAHTLEPIGLLGKATIPPFIAMVDPENASYRHAAVKVHTKLSINSKASTVTLAEATVDPQGDVREMATAILAERGAEANAAVPVLVKYLDPAVPDEVRGRALTALGRIAPVVKEAVPEMAKLLNDTRLRQQAFITLTDLGPTASPVLPQLVAAARDFQRSLSTVAENHTPTPIESVKQIFLWMHDDSPFVRANAQRLWNVLGAEYTPFVVYLLKSDLASDRALAIGKLCDLGQAAVPVLVRLLKDRDEVKRRTAIQLLGYIGPAARIAVPALTTVLKDSDWQLRSTAAIALGQIGAESKDVVSALAESLKDMDGDVRVCAIEALGRIGPAAAPAAAGLIERLRDKSPAVRSAAARALGHIGPGAKAALPELEKLGRDREDYVRQAADEAVKAIAMADARRIR